MLYILYSIFYTLYSILYILCSILYTLYSILYILYSIFHALHSFLLDSAVIYVPVMQTVNSCKRHPVWESGAKVHALSCSMVQTYEQLKEAFSVDDHSHYLFTPRDLTQWVSSLLRCVYNTILRYTILYSGI